MERPVLVVSPQDCGADGGVWCAYGSGGEQPGDQRRDDALSVVFDSAPLAAPLGIAGAAVLEAEIVSDRPDALLIARLCDVAADGASLRVSYGVLNCTHRDGHAHPTPMPVGEPVRVRLQLNDCAHLFPAGHRVRLALSTAYWPLVWPSAAAARLTVRAAELSLPQRAAGAQDAALPALPPPEAAPPLARTFMRQPLAYRHVARDQLTGAATAEARDDTGFYRIESNGLEYELWSLDRFAIQPDDPLGATGEVTFEMRLGRGDWRTRSVTRTVLRADATQFVIDATLDAWDGEAQIAARRWQVTVPRQHV